MNYNQRTTPRRACDVCSGSCGSMRHTTARIASEADSAAPSLAMAYIPFQEWSEPYALAEGLDNGTIFPELNLPFYGSKFRCSGGYSNDMQRRGSRCPNERNI